MVGKIGILSSYGISPLGKSSEIKISDSYFDKSHKITQNSRGDWVSKLPDSLTAEIELFCQSRNIVSDKYSKEAKMIAFVTDQLINEYPNLSKSVLNVATSRGSVDYLTQNFLSGKSLPIYSSPHSTPGFLSSWPVQLLRNELPMFYNSSTCSSFGISLMNACAWLKSGMADSYIAASVEAPTHQTTIDQLKALRIYSKENSITDFPCRSMDINKTSNTLVLGESSYAYILKNNTLNCLASIDSLGVGIEKAITSTSLSEGGSGLIAAVQAALKDADFPKIDLIIGHFPGTIKGDLAELAAYSSIFGNDLPHIISNKWKVGHSLGSSMASNLDLALQIFKKQELPMMPPYHFTESENIISIRTILISSLGFGGQAVSAIVSKVIN